VFFMLCFFDCEIVKIFLKKNEEYISSGEKKVNLNEYY